MKVYHSSLRHDWETPPDLFAVLDREFSFTLDAAASPQNALCKDFLTEQDDALLCSWGEHSTVFVNPPYGRQVGEWLRVCAQQSLVRTVVALVAARPGTSYWWNYVWDRATEVRFIRGRLHFNLQGVPQEPAPFESAVIIYVPGEQATTATAWDWRIGDFR